MSFALYNIVSASTSVHQGITNWKQRYVYNGAPLVSAGTHATAMATGGCLALLFRRYVWPHRYFYEIWKLSKRDHRSLRPSGLPINSTLRRSGYAVGYNNTLRNPQWSAFIICRQSLELYKKRDGGARNETFFADKDVAAPVRNTVADFTNTGYDKGHLAPRASVAFSEHSAKESFALTNVAFQDASLNRQVWRQLEWCTRRWAMKSSGWTGIVVGPAFAQSATAEHPSTIKRVRGIAVPTHFYMAVLDFSTRNAIGFIMENTHTPKADGGPEAIIQAHGIPLEKLEQKLSAIQGSKVRLFRKVPWASRPSRLPQFMGFLPGCDKYARKVDKKWWVSRLSGAIDTDDGAPVKAIPPKKKAKRSVKKKARTAKTETTAAGATGKKRVPTKRVRKVRKMKRPTTS